MKVLNLPSVRVFGRVLLFLWLFLEAKATEEGKLRGASASKSLPFQHGTEAKGGDTFDSSSRNLETSTAEEEIRSSDEKFSVSSLDPSAFLEALNEVRPKFTKAAMDKVEDAMKETGALEIIQDFADMDWAGSLKPTLDAFKDEVEDVVEFIIDQVEKFGGPLLDTIAGPDQAVCGMSVVPPYRGGDLLEETQTKAGETAMQKMSERLGGVIQVPSVSPDTSRKLFAHIEAKKKEHQDFHRRMAYPDSATCEAIMDFSYNPSDEDVKAPSGEPSSKPTSALSVSSKPSTSPPKEECITISASLGLTGTVQLAKGFNVQFGFGMGLDLAIGFWGTVASGVGFGGSLGIGYKKASVDTYPAGKVHKENSATNVDCPKGLFCKGGSHALFTLQSNYDLFKDSPENSKWENYRCKAGSFCPTGSTAEDGKSPVAAGGCSANTSCKCSKDYYCPKGSKTEMGKPLTTSQTPSGFTCQDGASCVCKDSTGKYKGYYCPIGSSEPQKCKKGKYCDGQNDPKPCRAGYFCPEGSTSEQGQPIKPIEGNPNGFNCGTNAPCLCPEGYSCPENNDEPVSCQGDSHYCPKGSTTSEGKPVVGPVTANAQACDQDQPCPCPDHFQCTNGLPEPCEEGFICENGTKEPCPAGYYCEQGSTTTPTSKKKCPLNHFCDKPTKAKPEGSVNLCQDGFFCGETSTSNVGQPAFTVTTNVDGVTCVPPNECRCPENFFCNNKDNTGSSVLNLKKCPAKKRCPGGTADPLPCEPGTYCEEGKAPQECPVGHYCGLESDTPTKCSDSQHCPKGSHAPGNCPKGYTCSDSGQAKCPSGHYCPGGGQEKTACTEDGFFCPEGSTAPKGQPIEG